MSGAIKKFLIAMIFCGAALPRAALAEKDETPTKSVGLSLPLQKAVHEAENLSVMKDRILATNVLLRNIKKSNKDESRILKEKLLQLAKYFYTDKGFQAYLAGKELFEKQKFADATEKFAEADDLENGNIEVLHLLTLSQLWQRKTALAIATNKRALQVCPLDVDVQRDALESYRDNADWALALKAGEALTKDFGDGSAQTLKDLAQAQIKLEKAEAPNSLKNEALRNLEVSYQKDPKQPETWYWLAQLKEAPEAAKLLAKYVEFCKNNLHAAGEHLINERETAYCAHLAEAEKGISL